MRPQLDATQLPRWLVDQAERIRFAEVIACRRAPASIFDDWKQIGTAGQPAFQNGYQNYGSGYSPLRYRVDSSGFVHVLGVVVTAGAPNVVTTLPVGYRPSGTEYRHGMAAAEVDGTPSVFALYPDGTLQSNNYGFGAWLAIELHFRP